MENVFYQGYLDSLCGIYSILNADKLVNRTSESESLGLFQEMVELLDLKGVLKDIVIYGSDHTIMKMLIKRLGKERFPVCITNKRGIIKLNDWWNYSQEFLAEGEHRAIILSLGGKVLHLTVIKRMTNRMIYLRDSSGNWTTIKKSDCKIMGYPDVDKYIIYPSQCWYLGKE